MPGRGEAAGAAAVYFDTSALLKLVIAADETEELVRWIASVQDSGMALTSSDVARTELLRTVRRHAPDRMRRARDVLDGLDLITVTPAIFEAAALIDPTELRSLDAIHLAVALDLGDSLYGLACYDQRLCDAARALGIRIVPEAG